MSLFNKIFAHVQGWCHVWLCAALHHRHARSGPLQWEAHWSLECPQSFSWPESGSRNILCGKYFFETVSAFFESSWCLKHRSIRLQMLWEMRHRGGGQSWGQGIDGGRGRLALVWRSLGISWTPLLHHVPVVVWLWQCVTPANEGIVARAWPMARQHLQTQLQSGSSSHVSHVWQCSKWREHLNI